MPSMTVECIFCKRRQVLDPIPTEQPFCDDRMCGGMCLPVAVAS